MEVLLKAASTFQGSDVVGATQLLAVKKLIIREYFEWIGWVKQNSTNLEVLKKRVPYSIDKPLETQEEQFWERAVARFQELPKMNATVIKHLNSVGTPVAQSIRDSARKIASSEKGLFNKIIVHNLFPTEYFPKSNAPGRAYPKGTTFVGMEHCWKQALMTVLPTLKPLKGVNFYEVDGTALHLTLLAHSLGHTKAPTATAALKKQKLWDFIFSLAENPDYGKADMKVAIYAAINGANITKPSGIAKQLLKKLEANSSQIEQECYQLLGRNPSIQELKMETTKDKTTAVQIALKAVQMHQHPLVKEVVQFNEFVKQYCGINPPFLSQRIFKNAAYKNAGVVLQCWEAVMMIKFTLALNEIIVTNKLDKNLIVPITNEYDGMTYLVEDGVPLEELVEQASELLSSYTEEEYGAPIKFHASKMGTQ